MAEFDPFPEVDGILALHAEALGGAFQGYRNHATRVLHLLFALAPGLRAAPGALLVAAACHDLGIWTAGTFDYLEPSCALARRHLAERGLSGSSEAVARIIQWHHKLRTYRGPDAEVVEAFRRADLVDLSLGRVRFGLEPAFVAGVRAAFPNAGFHRLLLALGFQQLRRSPLRPLPMVRW